tara:strand:+ start:1155 stop:2993 length:1839 start_codon:yes stop_codon:yes gene_type:complete
MHPVLQLSDHITLLPVIHGSGDFALEVRQRIHADDYDCVAIPIPDDFEEAVEEAIGHLPRVHIVAQREGGVGDEASAYSFVPIDPCQPLIAAIREALAANITRAYIDLGVENFEQQTATYPDPYALKQISLEKFDAALVTGLPRPEPDSQRRDRIRWMAHQLHLLELDYERILFVCSVMDWPWIREAYQKHDPAPEDASPVWPAETFYVVPNCLYFVLGELPYITQLYEHRRAEMMPDETQAIDGIKSLILEARSEWVRKHDLESHWLTPQTLSLMLKYIRNLTLLDSRMSPDLYNIALAAKQIGGDDFATTLIETARRYTPQIASPHPEVSLRFDLGIFPSGDADTKNRLLGAQLEWRELPLQPSPPEEKQQKWSMQWDPYRQCSYPPEDDRIESFNAHVREQARILIGEDLARSEKFTSSLKDGLDIRETLRNWHTRDLYVRELPPSKGSIDAVIFLYDTPADPHKYPWHTTWYAEHNEESTLCFYATDFSDNILGPGIAQAIYGGCFLLFPPRSIPDVWTDPRFEEAETLEERLIMGATLHSNEKRIALVSPVAPSAGWRRIAKQLKKRLVYIPMNRFSLQTLDRLRRFHVLNGREVRSYASQYIRNIR